MIENTPLRRRTLALGAAWSLPVVAATGAAPALAASGLCATCKTYQLGRSGPRPCPDYDWNGTNVHSLVGGGTLTITTSVGNGGTANPANGTYGTANIPSGCNQPTKVCSGMPDYPNFGCATNGNPAVGAPNFFADNGTGLILAMSGTTPVSVTTLTFSKPVCNVDIRIRDLSWYSGTNDGTAVGGRDAVYFDRAPTSWSNQLPTGTSDALAGNGAAPSTAFVRSVKAAKPPTYGESATYYDMLAIFAGPLTTLTMTWFNAPESGSLVPTSTSDNMFMMLKRITYCC